MHVTRIIKVSTLLLAIGTLVPGCEDDPILTPQNPKEQTGGSYGRIDKAGVERPENADAPEVTARPDENPALF